MNYLIFYFNFMKKVLLFSFTLLFSVLFVLTASAKSFPDVADGHTYNREIGYLSENKFVNGFSDGTFRPENEITRGELTKIVINSVYSQDRIDDCSFLDEFPDVSSVNVFYDYICMAKKYGVINGYSDGTFKPNDTITFAEALKVIMRALDSELTIGTDADLSEYLSRLEMKEGIPPTLNLDLRDKKINRGEIAFLIHMIREDYVGFPELPKPTYNVTMIPYQDANIDAIGMYLKTSNFGYHCTTTGERFVEINVTLNGQSQKIKLNNNCDGSQVSADLFGYRFVLEEVRELVAWDVNSFRYDVVVSKL